MGIFGPPNIGKLSGKKNFNGLINALNYRKDEDIREDAAVALGVLGDPRAIEPLVAALNDEDEDYKVRSAAAGALGGIGDKRAVEHLFIAFKKVEDEYVRTEIGRALGVLGHLEPLEQLLGEGQTRFRIDAASALVGIRGLYAAPILVRALNDNEKYEAAAWAIAYPLMNKKRINKKRLAKALVPAIQYLINMLEQAEPSEGARSFDGSINRAIDVLGKIGDYSAIPVLKNLLSKVKQKVKKEGTVQEYVYTDNAEGYISTDDDINHIEFAISEIKERQKDKK